MGKGKGQEEIKIEEAAVWGFWGRGSGCERSWELIGRFVGGMGIILWGMGIIL